MEKIIPITSITELHNNKPICFQHGGVPYCVVHFNGQIKAFISLCSHEDKVFTPTVRDNCLVCPFHKVSFDILSGEVRDNNGKCVPEGLRPVETLTREGMVYLITQEGHRGIIAQSEERRATRRAKKHRRSLLGILGFRRN